MGRVESGEGRYGHGFGRAGALDCAELRVGKGKELWDKCMIDSEGSGYVTKEVDATNKAYFIWVALSFAWPAYTEAACGLATQ